MTYLKLLFTTICFLTLNSLLGQNFKLGDKVEAYDVEERNWFPSEVIKIEQNKYLIHYDGYAATYDFWTDTDRLRNKGNKKIYKPYEYKVGERVEGTADKGYTWPIKAKILKKENNRWLIHHDGTTAAYDLVQSEVNIRPCPNCTEEEVKTVAATTNSGKYPGDGVYQKYDFVEVYDKGIKNWAPAVLAEYNESSKGWSVQGLGLMWSRDNINETETATRLRKPLTQPKVIAGRSNPEVMKQMMKDLAPYKDGIDAFENSYNYSSGRAGGNSVKALGFGSIDDQNTDIEKAKKQIADMEAAVKIVKEKYNNEPNEYSHYWTENPQVILFLWENKDECIKRFIVRNMSYDMTILYQLNTLAKINFKEEKNENYLFYEYFAKVNGFNELIASFNNKEEIKYYTALNAKNPYNCAEVEKTYRVKEKEYMAYVEEYSKTENIVKDIHNPTLEALAKKEFLAYYPKAVILKSWLNKPDYSIRKNYLDIPEYKFNLVYVLCTSPDYKTQFYTYIDVTCNYAGGGKYGAPFANFDKIMWAQRTGFILNK